VVANNGQTSLTQKSPIPNLKPTTGLAPLNSATVGMVAQAAVVAEEASTVAETMTYLPFWCLEWATLQAHLVHHSCS